MIPVVGHCLACGEEIYNYQMPCPKCGYKFSAGDNRYCPNNKYGICQVTEIPCREGIRWATCGIKNKADSESRI